MSAGSHKPRIVSLFSGAGCFDIGFEKAGFKTLVTTDQSEDCCKTLAINRDWTVVNGSISELSSKAILSSAGIRKREVELVIGGPPCQPYSKSAFGGIGGLPLGHSDHRASTVQEYMRVVRDLLPKAFVIENVPQFISGKNISMKKYLEGATYRINRMYGTKYRLNFCQLNAAWYGVPQLRDRLFIVASRDGHSFELPEIRYQETADVDLGIEQYRSVWDSIGHLSHLHARDTSLQLHPKWAKILSTIPPGHNYLFHTSRGDGKNLFEWRSRYWNFLLKLHPFRPSWTIAANPGSQTGPFHWSNRRLATQELQSLQTIPSAWKFAGSNTSIRRQIGNGVPSAIGELLGLEIRRQFFSERKYSNFLSLVPEKRALPNRRNRQVDLHL